MEIQIIAQKLLSLIRHVQAKLQLCRAAAISTKFLKFQGDVRTCELSQRSHKNAFLWQYTVNFTLDILTEATTLNICDDFARDMFVSIFQNRRFEAWKNLMLALVRAGTFW